MASHSVCSRWGTTHAPQRSRLAGIAAFYFLPGSEGMQPAGLGSACIGVEASEVPHVPEDGVVPKGDSPQSTRNRTALDSAVVFLLFGPQFRDPAGRRIPWA
jgi:hypothetical protein